MKSTVDFAEGFVMGSLVGGAVAMLLAPQSGRKTQEQIGRRATELRESAGVEAKRLQEAAGSQIRDARERAGEAATEVKHRAESLQAKGAAFMQESRDQLAKAVESVKEAVSEAG